MVQTFELPDLGEGIREAEIQDILVTEGDQVEEGQEVLTVETDKAVVDVPSPMNGLVQEIRVESGQLVRVGDVLVIFGSEGEEAQKEQKGVKEGEQEGAGKESQKGKEERKASKPEEKAPTKGKQEPTRGPVPASPSTRRLARELEVDLNQVPASGPGGRVTAEDVRSFAQQGEKEKRAPVEREEPRKEPRAPKREREASSLRTPHVSVPPLPDFDRWGSVERVPLRSVRRTVAQNMARGWSQIPHVHHQDVADVTEIEQIRHQHQENIEEQGGKLTLMVMVIKAAVAALKDYPRFNASLDTEAQEIILKHYYHLGIAVDTDRGLIVPVIRDVDRKSLTELAIEINELVRRTRDGKASLEDLRGGTFTITNVGIIGGTAFSPIIYYPQVAILGMARAQWRPMVMEDEEDGKEQRRIEPRYMLPLMLAFDHRVVDGADAARFVRRIIRILQDPGELLLAL